MSLSDAAATRQMVRLAILPTWNGIQDEGKEELRQQLKGIFADEKTASKAIDIWMRDNKWVPTPMDLHALAADLAEKPYVAADRDCDTCQGTGFKTVYELHTYLGGVNKYNKPIKTVDLIDFDKWRELRQTVDEVSQRVAECSDACHCRYGQHLAQERRAERDRKAAEGIARRKK